MPIKIDLNRLSMAQGCRENSGLKAQTSDPEKLKPIGCIENSDPLGVSKTQTPEKLRPTRCIENSDPVILLIRVLKVAHEAITECATDLLTTFWTSSVICY